MSRKDVIEVSGNTVELAVEAGLNSLRISRENVSVEVLDEGSRGLLGIGRRDAKVRLTVYEDPTPSVVKTPAPKPKPAARPAPKPKVQRKRSAPSTTSPAKSEPKAKKPAPQAQKKQSPAKKRPKRVEKSKRDVKPSSEKSAPKSVRAKQGSRPSRRKESRRAPAPVDPREGEIAKKHLETLLDLMGIEAEIAITQSDKDDLTGSRIPILVINGDQAEELIGIRGQGLASLQFLLRQMTSQSIHGKSRFVIDINGQRKKRQERLALLANRMAGKAISSNKPVFLNPMPPHERRIIHMTLRENSEVITRSKGEGDRRRIQILPRLQK